MTDLPPLPKPGRVMAEPPSFYKDEWKEHKLFTADQMRAYGAACAAAEREECEIKVIAAGMRRVKSLDLREEVERLRAAAQQARAALQMTLMLKRLGGMLPGTHERVQLTVEEAEGALRALDEALDHKT